MYGERATPYQVLAELGDRLAGEYAADDVLDRVASILASERLAALGGGMEVDKAPNRGTIVRGRIRVA